MAAIVLGTAVATVVGLNQATYAANFVMNNNDGVGEASYSAGTRWTGGAAPSAGNTYQTGAFRLRSPASNPAAPIVFAGDSLEISTGGNFRIKTSNLGLQINNLILANNSIVELSQPSGSVLGTLSGAITVNSGATAIFMGGNSTDGTTHVFTVSAPISGSGGLTTGNAALTVIGAGAPAQSNGTVILTGDNSFTGGAASNGLAGSTLRIGNANAVKNSTLTVGINGGVTFASGLTSFNLGGLAGSGTLNLVSLAPSPAAVTLDIGGGVNNNSASYGGVMSGAGSIIKSGTGTQTFTAANNYTGSTTVRDGTLALGSAGAISNTLVLGVSGGTSGILDVTAKAAYTQNTVSGNGTINIGAGKTVSVTGAIAPGFSVGTLNVTGNLSLGTSTAMELAGTGGVAGTDSDFVNATGGITYAGALTLSSFGGHDLTQAAVYNLFDFAGADAGDFASVTIGGTPLVFASNVWLGTSGSTTFTFSEGTGVLTVAVPEPATLGLVGLSMLGLVGRRRRVA